MTIDQIPETRTYLATSAMRHREKRERKDQPVAKILIVDDEPFNVDILEQELEELGYGTASAMSGQEALAKIASEAPDLILLDVMMPGMDGFTVCRILKGQETTQLIPIVIMTALGAKEDRIKGIEAGADDFLTKPVDRRELLARIQAAIKMKQAVDRLKEQRVPDNSFHREGEYWTIAYQGKIVRIKDSSGLRYLAYLLRYPHKEIHVMTLVASVEGQLETVLLDFKELNLQIGLGDAGEILDIKAKASYKQRLSELREELADAQRCNDIGRVAKTDRELEFLTQELIHAVGIGGKDKKAASPAERARVNVQRAIKAALERIALHHPNLGAYLASTVRTGMYCVYLPDLQLSSGWQI